MTSLIGFARAHRQALFNGVLFVVIGQYIVREVQFEELLSAPTVIDVTFFVYNLAFLAVIISRREYVIVDRSWVHWLVAIASFFSGMFFIKDLPSDGLLLETAETLNIIAVFLGIAAFVSLGRSFGIVPALRVIRTGGLYRIVRHPMYMTDILMKIPIVLKYLSMYNAALLLTAIVLYVIRARYEETLLSSSEEYRAFMAKVRYRFIPYIY